MAAHPGDDTFDIEVDRIYTVFDHDGNVHPGDIGKDYFYDDLGFEDTEAFVDEVRRLRGEDDPREPMDGVYCAGEGHSDAEELAIFIAERRMEHDDITREDVEDLARTAVDDGYDEDFRDGFPEFINDLVDVGGHPIILSAGDQTFLRTFYQESDHIDADGVGLDNGSDLHVLGSLQNWAQTGIDTGCGNAKKPIRYEEALQRTNGSDKPMLYSGDSGSDRQPLLRADLGVATGSGAEPYADVVVKEDPYFDRKESWYGQAGVTLIYAGLVQGLEEDT
ncbi:MAG: hypothetical protein SV186_01915, partial [Candidatus Nanohaloarchaea archaeon]|nr:hypothetical protein [Candidatus Nanohaloarchaea archaeon]